MVDVKLGCAFFVLAVQGAFGQTNINWLAPASGDWSEPANWSGGNVPSTAMENAIVRAVGSPYIVSLAQTYDIGRLEVGGTHPRLDILAGGALRIHEPELVLDGLGDRVRLLAESELQTARLRFMNDATIVGPGSLVLRDSLTGGRVYLESEPGVTVTVGDDAIIRGHGTIRANLINEGLIEANQLGHTLSIESDSVLNRGLILAGSAEYVRIDGVSVVQEDGGEIVGQAGRVILAEGTSITGGRLSAQQGARFSVEGDVAFVDLLSVDGRVDCDDGTMLTLSGSEFVNNGDLSVAHLHLASSMNVTGSGRIEFADLPQGGALTAPVGTVITHGAGHTLDMAGQEIQVPIVNQGSITGSIALKDVLHTNGGQYVGVLKMENARIEQSVSGDARVSRLEMEDSQIIGGGLESDGATVLCDNAEFEGVELDLDSATRIEIEGGGLVLRDIAWVRNDARWRVSDGAALVLDIPIFEVGADWDLVSSGGNPAYRIQLAQDCVFEGTGVLDLGHSRGVFESDAGATVLFSKTLRVEGVADLLTDVINYADMEFVSFDMFDARFENHGTILGGMDFYDADVFNYGSLVTYADGQYRFVRSTLTQGQVAFVDAHAYRVTFEDSSVRGGELRSPLDHSSNLFRCVGMVDFDDLILKGRVQVRSGAALTLSEVIRNDGWIEVRNIGGSTGSLLISDDLVLSGTGEISLETTAEGPSRIAPASGFSGAFTNPVGHTVRGDGDIQMAFVNEGICRPSQEMIVSDSFTQPASGTLEHVLSEDDAGLIAVTGVAHLDGTLRVMLTQERNLEHGDSSVVLTAPGGVSGTFASIDDATIAPFIAVPEYQADSVLLHYFLACAADWNNDGQLLTSDIVAFINDYVAVLGGGGFTYNDPDIAAPLGVLNTADFVAYLNAFNAGCP